MEAFLKTGKCSKSVTSSSSERGSKGYPVPWVEKYRPRHISQVVQQEQVVAVLGKIIQGADLPNLLFYGPPGTGKTSTILAAARELFGDVHYRERTLELNASDERGIAVIREKVKKFSQQTAVGLTLEDGRVVPAFKLVILDEADAMTHAAQSALRRTMEKETKSTRFCLLCNYLSRIIPPITSRCSKFRFKPLDQETLSARLKYICGEENVKYKSGVIQALIDNSGGDLRKAITQLQSVCRLKGEGTITIEDVEECAGVVGKDEIKKFWTTMRGNNWEKVEVYVEDSVGKRGVPAAKILEGLCDFLLAPESNEISDSDKAKVLEKLGEVNYRLMDGASEYLQLMDLGGVFLK